MWGRTPHLQNSSKVKACMANIRYKSSLNTSFSCLRCSICPYSFFKYLRCPSKLFISYCN